MNFKMTSKDFEQLAAFIEKKAKGTELRFKCEVDQKMEVYITLMSGETAIITFFDEQLNNFAKITRSRNLGEEL